MVFQQYASEDRPIYLIKCAFSGSGFVNSAPNWAHDNTFSGYNANNNLYETYFSPFVKNNLKLIEDESGRTPVIKGFLWHQGESDSGNGDYDKHLSSLVSRFNPLGNRFWHPPWAARPSASSSAVASWIVLPRPSPVWCCGSSCFLLPPNTCHVQRRTNP